MDNRMIKSQIDIELNECSLQIRLNMDWWKRSREIDEAWSASIHR